MATSGLLSRSASCHDSRRLFPGDIWEGAFQEDENTQQYQDRKRQETSLVQEHFRYLFWFYQLEKKEKKLFRDQLLLIKMCFVSTGKGVTVGEEECLQRYTGAASDAYQVEKTKTNFSGLTRFPQEAYSTQHVFSSIE